MLCGAILSNFNEKIMLLRQVRSLSCWSCSKDINNLVANLFCDKCNALQRPNKQDTYFKIMGLSETYDLDEADLSKRYKDLQRYLHPDKFATRNKQELEISEKYSSLVNEAYKTLLEPLARGIYILHLKGQELPENTEINHQFLMQIMEKNEEVEEAETEEEIMRLNNENKAKIKELQEKVSKAFFKGDLKSVIRLLSHMKYYTSIDAQIQSVIRNKGIIR